MPETLHLHGLRNRWTLASLGGRLAGWEALDGETWRTVCKGDPSALPSRDAHRAIVMFPWVNRIGGAEWSCEGEHVPLDHSGSHTHLHGVTYDREWEVIEESDRAAAFRFVVNRQKHYPRRIEGIIRYEIVEEAGMEALQVAMTARNLEESEIAYATMGIHPYFVNPYGGKVDGMELFCAQEKEFAVDDKLIPTGLIKPIPAHDFRAPRAIGDTFMDYGFELKRGASPAARLAVGDFMLTIHPVENCGYTQIYIPPHREEIALEPQSGGADAFRFHGFGLRRLQPGESFTWRVRMAARFGQTGAVQLG